MIPSDGAGKVETILSNGLGNIPSDWADDGRSLLIQTSAIGMGMTDIQIHSFYRGQAEPWLSTPFVEKQARFSRGGRWIAYESDESGRMEVYVRGHSPPGGKWRVSSDGGSGPVWSRDARELFYVAPDGTMMSVRVGPGPAFQGSSPVPLFRIPGSILNYLGVVTQYDVSPDGRRFLLNLNSAGG